MTSSPGGDVVHHLRRAALLRDGAGLTDAELLEAFVSRRDGASFEALVRRHGPMVLGVCGRVLRDPHDAEDAFQATFLVLVRRAATVVPRERVGNWLYGVAYRTALEARRLAARRRARERQVEDMPQPTAEPDAGWHELRPLLDRELSRLPDKYREPVVLCHLEGRTRQEAARHLGLPVGTVSGRLTTARRLLAKRLSRHGLTLSAGGLAAVLTPEAATAAVPSALVASTVQVLGAAGSVPAPVAVLADGVLRVLPAAKLKAATALVLAAVALGGGTGLVAHHLREAERPREDVEPPPPVVVVEQSDQDRLQGTWVVVSSERAGEVDNDENLRHTRFLFTGDRMRFSTRKGGIEGTFQLDATAKPKQIDAEIPDGLPRQWIYEWDGKRLKICFAKSGKRPRSFDTREGSVLYVLEKQP
jgi:RNA polymerase sigma factor (sigma-70 family)